ncbi:MAG TPA: glycosyltransferase family 9 protein [Candidatus Methylomirabilis sp.]|nr:glycosyltransferase family 9 protein [Candidatus Methylomirabilis sp.]
MICLHASLASVAATRPEPRLTVVRAGALGDTILVLPVLQLLRDQVPGARLTLVGSAWAESLRPLLAFRLETARIDDPALTPLFATPPLPEYPARGRVGSHLFRSADAVIVYTASPTADFVRNVIACCRGPVIVQSVTPPEGTHAAMHLARAIVSGTLPLGDLPFPALRPPPDLEGWARQWVGGRVGVGGRTVAIHPGSGGRHKQWPPACFATLAAEVGDPVVLLEGPADAEACREAASEMSPALPVALAAGLSLPQVAALLSACRIYVGNDSGISHLAAALGVPTVVVAGPTDPCLWRPLGPRVAVVRPDGGSAWPTPAAVLLAARRLEA